MQPLPGWIPYLDQDHLNALWEAAPNAFVALTRLDGTPVFSMRRVQVADQNVLDDPGFVEIMPESSTAMGPILRKTLRDLPSEFATYQRGDLVTLQAMDGQEIEPNANPFHILRVNRPGSVFASTQVYLARVDMLIQKAVLFSRITELTPGAQRTTAFSLTRAQATSRYSASLNDQWMVEINGVPRIGYLPGVTINVGINNYSVTTEQEIFGLVKSKHRVLIVEDPVVLERGDVVVQANADRVVVSDTLHTLQRVAVTLATLVKCDWRMPTDPVYTIS